MKKPPCPDPFIQLFLSAIVLACFAIMLSFLGGCAEEDGALPQERSETELVPDQDVSSARTIEFAASAGFDRAKARSYVERYAKSPNPNLAYCAQWAHEGARVYKEAADCTNFASQVLWYAGVSMRYGSAEDGWWYAKSCGDSGSSKSWRQVNRLLEYLVVESGLGEFKKSERDLKVGDLIFYRLRREDESYRCDAENLFNHTAVVSGFDARGEPLVSYHSNDALDVPWDAKNGTMKALGEACATAFVHIKD